MMKVLSLGNTGVEVSALCLGCMRLGWYTDEEVSIKLLDQYIEAGGTFLDTANMYGFGGPKMEVHTGEVSERLLGKWMKERGNREALFVASKVGVQHGDVPRGLSANLIEEGCEKSLQRLGVDTIDLYYAHADDRNTPIEEMMEAFDRLKKAGKVRFLGVSNFLLWRIVEAQWVSQTHNWETFCCVQHRYTYLRSKPGANFGNQIEMTPDMIEYAKEKDLGLLAYSPLLSGTYTRADRELNEQYPGPDSDTRLAALNAVAQEIGVTANQVVLAWMLKSDPPVIPLVAVSSQKHLTENLGALAVELSDEQMARLNNASG
jgi:aryl-alcohol dehydrogenase-like predicted oxidoreductase